MFQHVIDGREVVTPRLLIYDIIQFEEHKIGQLNYNMRRTCIGNEIIRPRKEAQAVNLDNFLYAIGYRIIAYDSSQ